LCSNCTECWFRQCRRSFLWAWMPFYPVESWSLSCSPSLLFWISCLRIICGRVNLPWLYALYVYKNIIVYTKYILMGLQNRSKPSNTIGHKVRQGLEIAGTLKGMYDLGSTLYRGAQFAAPLIAGLML
jgi:hypothetical protein